MTYVYGTMKQKLIRLFAAAALFTMTLGAHAQFSSGQILTAAQLNSALAAKTNNAAAAITGGTITGLSAPVPLSSGGTGGGSPVAAVANLIAPTVVPILGCDTSGSTDASACVQARLNSIPNGGRVKITGKLLINSNVTIPAGVAVEGDCVLPGSIGSNSNTPYASLTCGVLMVSSSATINMSSGTSLNSVYIYRAGMAFPSIDSSAFAGTAVTAVGEDTSLDHVMIMGFNKAYYNSGYNRSRIEYLYGDNINGIEITNSGDIDYISHCHMWPFATIAYPGQPWTAITRTGIAYYLHDFVDWGKITDSFAYGYAIGFSISNVNSTTLIGVGADNAYASGPLNTTAIGISVTGTSQETRIIGAQTAAQGAQGIYINTTGGPGGNVTQIIGGDIWGGSTDAIKVDSGDAIIIGSQMRGTTNGITVNNSASSIAQSANRFESITGSNFNFTGGATQSNMATTQTFSNQITSSKGSAGALQITDTTASAGANIKLTGDGGTTPNKYIRVSGGFLQILNSAYSGSLMNLSDAGAMTVTGLVNAQGGIQSNGVTISPVLSGTSASIGGSALAAGACSSATVSVTGATTAMAVEASPATYPGDSIYWRGYVSAAGTVTVKVCAAVAATPTASTYNVRVLQ